MRYLFSKSKYILILSFFTAFFVTIAFSNIVRAFHLTGQMQDLLSTDYYALSVNNVAKPADIIQIAEQYRGSGVLVLRYKENGTCGVYAAGRDFTPQITSGRKFTEDDLQSQNPMALIIDEYKNQITKYKGKQCILLENRYFEVIGTFQRADNVVNRDASIYYNLSALTTKQDGAVTGQYALDAGADSAQFAEAFHSKIDSDYIHTPADLSYQNRLHIAVFNQAITILPLILVVAMILLNSINVTMNWIDKRKQELIARKICGATSSDLLLRLNRDYIFVVTVSYVIGFAAVAIVSRFVHSAFFVGFDLSPVTFLISLTTTLLIGMIAIGIMMLSSQMKTITEQRGA